MAAPSSHDNDVISSDRSSFLPLLSRSVVALGSKGVLSEALLCRMQARANTAAMDTHADEDTSKKSHQITLPNKTRPILQNTNSINLFPQRRDTHYHGAKDEF